MMRLIRRRIEVTRARAATVAARQRLALPAAAWETRIAAHPLVWLGGGFAAGALIGSHPRQRRRVLALMRLFGRGGASWLVHLASYVGAAIAAARQ